MAKRMLLYAGIALAFAMNASALEPVIVAGGALDPVITNADIYIGAPMPAEAPTGQACEAGKRYIELVNAGRFSEVVDLFEDDAVIMEPRGRTLRGRAEISSLYQGSISAMRPTLVAVAYVGDDTDCMVEIARETEIDGQKRYVLVSVDHFTMGAGGRFVRMVAFARVPRG